MPMIARRLRETGMVIAAEPIALDEGIDRLKAKILG